MGRGARWVIVVTHGVRLQIRSLLGLSLGAIRGALRGHARGIRSTTAAKEQRGDGETVNFAHQSFEN